MTVQEEPMPTTLSARRWTCSQVFGAAALFSVMLAASGCADAPASTRGGGVGAALGSGIALATGAGVAGTIGGALIGGAVGYAGGWAAGGN
jgi:hypothetical protein